MRSGPLLPSPQTAVCGLRTLTFFPSLKPNLPQRLRVKEHNQLAKAKRLRVIEWVENHHQTSNKSRPHHGHKERHSNLFDCFVHSLGRRP